MSYTIWTDYPGDGRNDVIVAGSLGSRLQAESIAENVREIFAPTATIWIEEE